ncbi:MAG: nicotinamide mononucleotide transporter [Bacteroidales bacterium]|nr:nicotinamide mononucleotide transporter [Bacteroidales bacterium]
MNDKKFNKIFSTVLMTLMVVVIAITTAFKLQDPQARVVMLLIAAFGSVMGVASTVLSANGILWTFFFGILDVTFCTIVAADNGLWGNFALHLFFFLPMQFVGLWQWRKRGASGAKTEVKARRLTPSQRWLVLCSVLVLLAVSYGVLIWIQLRTVAPDEVNRLQVFFDAAVFTFNIAGQILMSLAYMEQWILWNLVNISSICLWGSTMLSSDASSYTVVMFIKYCFYLVNSVNGLRIWINLSRNSGSEEALPEKEGCC